MLTAVSTLGISEGEAITQKAVTTGVSYIPGAGWLISELFKLGYSSSYLGPPKGVTIGTNAPTVSDPCNPPQVKSGTPPWSAEQTRLWEAQCAAVRSGGVAPAQTVSAYSRCRNLSGLAQSQCMAQVNRDASLRAVGKQQDAMGPVNIPSGEPFYQQPLFLAGAGAVAVLALILVLR